MVDLLQITLVQLNRIRLFSWICALSLRFIRALIAAGIMVGLWSLIKPASLWEQFALGVFALLGQLFLQEQTHSKKISEGELLASLEINYPATKQSPFRLRDKLAPPSVWLEWTAILEKLPARQWQFERGWLLREGLTIPMPAVILTLVLAISPHALRGAWDNVSNVVSNIGSIATLKVLEGDTDPRQKQPMNLTTSSPQKFKILAKNLLEVNVRVLNSDPVPRIDLRRLVSDPAASNEDRTLQSFQLAKVKTKDQGAMQTYSIVFALEEDAEVLLSTVSTKKPVAVIEVHRLPVPKVSLEIIGDRQSPWPDDKAVPLRITVRAQNPLEWVKLEVRAEDRKASELVANVMAQDKRELVTTYELLLEPYLENDISHVEIVAQALDRSLPTPLLGESVPIVLDTASAYGRYRRTLQTLTEIKKLLDQAVMSNPLKLSDKALEKVREVEDQVEESPFFDALDRYQITTLVMGVRGFKHDQRASDLLELSSKLNRFLFEHEVLNDQERDRDFFVAVRMLSRLLEEDKKERAVSVESVTTKIRNFLTERHARWIMRVERLGREFEPSLWGEVKKKPYHQAMEVIAREEKGDDNHVHHDALGLLSSRVAHYRKWITELEDMEEKYRSRLENDRRQGLTDARNMLRQLQKTQDAVSKSLDRAELKNAKIGDSWPSIRMEQNGNIKATTTLETKLRTLSPQAAERIRFALDNMKIVVDKGNTREFPLAETASDLASRLLRQAESAAQKSQQEEMRRGSRRRVSGDKYFGNQVVGGHVDLRHEYEVSRVYREDVLEDVEKFREDNPQTKELENLLDDYLMEIIR